MKRIFKKIKDSFKSKDSPFFGKDDEGNELFYPWGRPGFSYKIGGDQKKIVLRCHKFLWFFFFLIFLCWVFVRGVSDSVFWERLMFMAVINVPLIFYFLTMSYLIKKMIFYGVERVGFLYVFGPIVGLVIAHLGLLIENWGRPQATGLEIILGTVIFVYIFAGFLFLKKARKYSDEPKKKTLK